MNKQERCLKIVELLKKAYPDAACALHYDNDFELLFAARLSAQCTDVRVNIVTKELFKRFRTLQDYADADSSEIEAIVRPCGLGPTKSRDINASAKMLLADFGGKVPGNMDDLLKLPGVGRKIANLIMGDVFNQPAIIADTHCIRLSNRLWLVDNTKDPLKVEKALKALVPPSEQSHFCHRLVWHGRDTCAARKPMCANCCLAAVCPSFPSPL